MKNIVLKESINAKKLVSLIWKKKEFAKRLLANSLKDNKKDGEFEARIILNTVDFCLEQILKLQSESEN
jgi:hypothetical protein